MNIFGERLREERKKLGLNQSQFASLGGVQVRAQIHYEKNERRPDADYLIAIAAAGADVTYIITGVRTGTPGAQTPLPDDTCIDDVLAVVVLLEEWLAGRGGTMDPDIKAHAIRLIYDAWRLAGERKGAFQGPDKGLEKILEKLMDR